MQLVAADVGNSSIKFIAGDMAGDRIATAKHCHSLSAHELSTGTDLNFPELTQPLAWFVSSVNENHAGQLRQLAERAGWVKSWHEVHRQHIPLKIDLLEPDRVGIDRLLAAFAASRMFGMNRDTIVIDCGTALTIDFVDAKSVFRGGVIMAGPTTTLKALNSMTAALPDLAKVKLQRPESVLGRSTEQAMLAGAWYSGLGAIQQVVEAITRLADGDDVAVIGTGGGLGPWRDDLPSEWKVVDDLVLNGIFQVASELHQEQVPRERKS